MAPFRSVPQFRLLVAVILVLLTGLLARYPAHNGDLPFYIAAVFSGEGLSDSAALARAAVEIRAALPATEASLHLQNLSNAPAHFLDFYRIKVGYTGAIEILHCFGISYVTATVVPSLTAFFFLGLGVFLWAAKLFSRPVSLFFGLALLVVTGALQLGRISTPDAVSQCLLFWVMYRVRFGKTAGVTLFLLLAALLFRPDNFPALAGLLLLMHSGYASEEKYVNARLGFPAFLMALLAIPAGFALINHWSEPRFWWFRRVPYPGITDFPDPAPLTHFIRLMARGPMPVLLALAGIIVAGRYPLSRTVPGLLLFLAVMFPARYLLFPHYEVRFYSAFYLVGFLVLAGELAGRSPTADR